MNELVEDLDVEVCIWIIMCQYGKVLLYLQSIYKLCYKVKFVFLIRLLMSVYVSERERKRGGYEGGREM
jgi:hypothetical protein